MPDGPFPFWKRWIFRADAAAHAHLPKQSVWTRWLVRVLRDLCGGDRTLRVHLHGLSMDVYPHTYDAVAYACDPFEPYTTDLFMKSVRPGATVLDIGAQFGYYTLLAARGVSAKGSVVAFEPEPSNLALLRHNIALNPSASAVKVVPYALGETDSIRELFVYEGSASHSLHRHPKVVVKQTLPVRCVTLDEALPAKRVQVIKMDIEGHEPQALSGMPETLAASTHLVLFAEYAPAYLKRAGNDPRDYLQQLLDLGFAVRWIDESHKQLRSLEELPASDNPQWHVNLYCVKES